ncbi:hypothetical protein [Deinococcus pimensis]|uniref:hypothetical protein n=1 Tax=Deinococcus pimensis TaxID=309888 RepID=UPI0004B4F8EF|nr:hypothetical protein [Deinococcus pimensis]
MAKNHEHEHDHDRDDRYTDPALRARLKDEIQRGDRGGKPGQWSARKSQLLVREYEAHGGGYTTRSRDDAARSLTEWGDEDWRTVKGGGDARHGQRVERYLPKAVWNMLSEDERREAVRTKDEATRKGEQHVAWPDSVREAMREYEHAREKRRRTRERASAGEKKASRNADEPSRQALYDRARELGVRGRSRMTKDELREAVEAQKR